MTTMKDEYLYTDYAMQMLSAFMSKDSESLKKLFDGLEEEMEDPYFLSGITFGFLVHIEHLFISIARDKDTDSQSVFKKYAMHYSSLRDDLKAILPLNPKHVRKIFDN